MKSPVAGFLIRRSRSDSRCVVARRRDFFDVTQCSCTSRGKVTESCCCRGCLKSRQEVFSSRRKHQGSGHVLGSWWWSLLHLGKSQDQSPASVAGECELVGKAFDLYRKTTVRCAVEDELFDSSRETVICAALIPSVTGVL
jgi:hypothetical protein